MVIFASHLLFILGCIIGWNLNTDEKPIVVECIQEEQLKKWMLIGITVTMSIAAIAIVANLKTMISVYGFNLMEQIVLIYGDRVNETQKIQTIPYLGSFIFITLPLLGCYLKKFGFHVIVIPCVILACADALISGGRGGIVFALLLLLAGYMCMDKGYELSSRGRVLFLIISSLIIITFYIVKKKYHTFIKTCELLFYLVIIIKIISIILVIPLININNLQISFDYNYQLIIVALFILYLYKSIYYLNNYQLKNSELLISFISPLCIKLLTLLVIGNTLSNLYNYPYVIYLKKIKYFNFIERMDGILSFEYIFCFIVLISYTLLNTKKSQ